MYLVLPSTLFALVKVDSYNKRQELHAEETNSLKGCNDWQINLRYWSLDSGKPVRVSPPGNEPFWSSASRFERQGRRRRRPDVKRSSIKADSHELHLLHLLHLMHAAAAEVCIKMRKNRKFLSLWKYNRQSQPHV